MLSVVHETFLQMAPWFWSIKLAASRKLQRHFFYFLSFVHAQNTSERNSASFLSFAQAQRVRKWLWLVLAQTLQLLSWKIKKAFFFSWMTESRTFERLSILLERAIDFHDFQEQVWYSCNGRHVCMSKVQQSNIGFFSLYVTRPLPFP